MDFARKQLEKYGWTDGKGLGKHENGISEALKPKLKRSVTGIGHDPAAEFNEHWWTALYDKAAGNIEVKEKNNKTKKIKANITNFEITNSTWKLQNNKGQSEKEQYSEYFIRTAVIAKGGGKTEDVKESTQEDKAEKRDVFQMTDEELFRACEGRTAHKGARHGLKALGKLARIAQQEEMLLVQPQYNGYSHSKRKECTEDVIENTSLEEEQEEKIKKKKKKKKKCVSGSDLDSNLTLVDQAVEIENSVASADNENSGDCTKSNKIKSKVRKYIAPVEGLVDDSEKEENVRQQEVHKPKKKKKRKNIETDIKIIYII